jgi:hypothetical protein
VAAADGRRLLVCRSKTAGGRTCAASGRSWDEARCRDPASPPLFPASQCGGLGEDRAGDMEQRARRLRDVRVRDLVGCAPPRGLPSPCPPPCGGYPARFVSDTVDRRATQKIRLPVDFFRSIPTMHMHARLRRPGPSADYCSPICRAADLVAREGYRSYQPLQIAIVGLESWMKGDREPTLVGENICASEAATRY